MRRPKKKGPRLDAQEQVDFKIPKGGTPNIKPQKKGGVGPHRQASISREPRTILELNPTNRGTKAQRKMEKDSEEAASKRHLPEKKKNST